MIQAFWRAMRDYWRESTRAQQTLFVTGSVLFVSMLVHGVVMVVSGGSINGPVSFRKAIVFAESLGLVCWSLGWLLPLLKLRPRTNWLLALFLVFFALGEAFLVTMQVWRGVPSHFNFSTLLDTLTYNATGVGAMLFTVLIALVLGVALRRDIGAPSLALSVRSGLILTLFGSAVGMLMALNFGGVWQGMGALLSHFSSNPMGHYAGPAADAYGGNLVALHAFGIHGLQLLPLVGWLLSMGRLPEATRLRVVWATIASLVLLLGVLAVQAFRMLPLNELDPVSLALLAVAGAVLLGSYAVAAFSVVRARPRLAQQPA